MSTYLDKAINPETGKKVIALFLDDYYGPRQYGIGFKTDGTDVTLETPLKEMKIYKDEEVANYEAKFYKEKLEASKIKEPLKSQKAKPKEKKEEVVAGEKDITVKELYLKLSAPIPEEFLITYEENGKTFTGYHAQYAINLLNEVLGLGEWDTKEEILKQELIGGAWVVAMKIELLLVLNDTGGHDIAVTGYGGSYAKDIANAYKGAKTSAFKNACRYLGIGKELYLKGFEDDIKVITEEAETGDASQESGKTVDEIANDLLGKIQQAKTHGELDSLYPEVEKTSGEATRKLLIKKFNERKLTMK